MGAGGEKKKDEAPRLFRGARFVVVLLLVARGRYALWSTLISWDFRVELVA
jgi:hypothetical protein